MGRPTPPPPDSGSRDRRWIRPNSSPSAVRWRGVRRKVARASRGATQPRTHHRPTVGTDSQPASSPHAQPRRRRGESGTPYSGPRAQQAENAASVISLRCRALESCAGEGPFRRDHSRSGPPRLSEAVCKPQVAGAQVTFRARPVVGYRYPPVVQLQAPATGERPTGPTDPTGIVSSHQATQPGLNSTWLASPVDSETAAA